MTEKQKSKLANYYQSTDPQDWGTQPRNWVKDIRQNGNCPQSWIEAQRDGLEAQLDLLETDELKRVLREWIALAMDAVRDQEDCTKETIDRLNADQLKQQLGTWVLLTLDAVRGFPSLDSRNNQ